MDTAMNKRIGATRLWFVAVALLGLQPAVHAQRMTEQYIPIGESPGISGEYSYIGPISTVDTSQRTITVRDQEEGVQIIQVTPHTLIWLDRTKMKQPNVEGDFSDCQSGRRVEVKFTDEDKSTAEWIKIEIHAERG